MITESDIEWAAAQGACEDAIAWLRESPRSIEDTIARHPDWLLEHACARMTDAQLAVAIATRPGAALSHEHVCARMSDDQFAVAIAARPWTALHYEHAFLRLTDAQFAAAIAGEPGVALSHKRACARMTDAQFAVAFSATWGIHTWR